MVTVLGHVNDLCGVYVCTSFRCDQLCYTPIATCPRPLCPSLKKTSADRSRPHICNYSSLPTRTHSNHPFSTIRTPFQDYTSPLTVPRYRYCCPQTWRTPHRHAKGRERCGRCLWTARCLCYGWSCLRNAE